MSELPVYATEVRCYRDILKIASETGSRLRKLVVLTSDAECDDRRPLFLLCAESVTQAKTRIAEYRARMARTRHNLPLIDCPKKTMTVTV